MGCGEGRVVQRGRGVERDGYFGKGRAVLRAMGGIDCKWGVEKAELVERGKGGAEKGWVV